MKTFDRNTISRRLRLVVEKNIWGNTVLSIYRYGRRFRFSISEARRFGFSLPFVPPSEGIMSLHVKLVAARGGNVITRWTRDNVFLNGYCLCRRGFTAATGLVAPKSGERRYNMVIA